MEDQKEKAASLPPESKPSEEQKRNLSNLKQQNEGHNVKKVSLGPNTER